MRISDWSSDVCSSDLLSSLVAGEIDRIIGIERNLFLVQRQFLPMQGEERLERVQMLGEGFDLGGQHGRISTTMTMLSSALLLMTECGAALSNHQTSPGRSSTVASPACFRGPGRQRRVGCERV